MKGLDNQLYVILLLISNGIALLQLIAALKWPGWARLSFFLLFAWACWMNWTTSQQTPGVYIDYANLTWSHWYSNFIHGWFAAHIQLAVGAIAVCQGLIAITMLLKGWIFKAGCTGAIIFLLCIVPFGVGSGFPATVVMAAAIVILLKKNRNTFIWQKRSPAS
ncbi:hypothetical protein [Ferruginibacter profundus]